MKVIALILLALFVAQVSAGVLFTRTVVPQGWTMGGLAAPNARVNFIMALKQRNLDQLEAKFWSVSDPESDDYQNFLSIPEINAMVSPLREHHDLVVNWLQAHGVMPTNIKSYGDAIEFITNVHVASRLFSAKFHVFTHSSGKQTVKSFGSYSLPDHIHALVDFVEGATNFPLPHFSIDHQGLQNNQNEIVIPETIDLLYNIPTLTPGSSPSTSQGVIEYEDEFFSNGDLYTFSQLCSITIPNVTSSHIVGQNDPTQPGVESSLDIQFIAGINTESTSWFWIEGNNVWLYGFAVHFLNTANVPSITSTSYGWWEGDQCEDGIGGAECQQLGVNSAQYVVRVNTEFQKIGVKGTTLIVASGDSGANGRTNGDCSVPQLRPAFPASSPYLTSVGATEMRNATYNLPNPPTVCQGSTYSCVSGGNEAAVSIDISGFASGGGFSNISSRPSYQDAAVKAYLNSGVKLPPSSYYNANGRGLPDVAAIGHAALIVVGGGQEVVGGTSQSSPTFAAIVTLLSEEYVKKTGNSFGFINPLLYQIAASNPTAFKDITMGDNICTEDGCSPGCQGFYATKGWDPVTGLGTPNYGNLLSAISSVADKVVARRAAKAAARQ